MNRDEAHALLAALTDAIRHEDEATVTLITDDIARRLVWSREATGRPYPRPSSSQASAILDDYDRVRDAASRRGGDPERLTRARAAVIALMRPGGPW